MAVNIVRRGFLAGLAGAAMLTPGVAAQQSTNVAALHAKVHKHLVIRNAMVMRVDILLRPLLCRGCKCLGN